MSSKGYWLIAVNVQDMDAFKHYMQAAAPAIRAFGGQFLVRGAHSQWVEGSGCQRQSVLEFPSYQQAQDCWHSEAYQAALKLRQNISTMNLLICEGYPPVPADDCA